MCGDGLRMPRPAVVRISIGNLALVVAIILPLLASQASGQDFIRDLAFNLDQASRFIGDAAAAIDECNTMFLDCLSKPEEFVLRLDAANRGLGNASLNISQLAAPPEHTSGHALLLQGLGNVSQGLSLYAEGLQDRQPTKLNLAIDLIQEGKEKIEAATAAILGQPTGGLDLVTILTAVVVIAAVALVVTIVVLVRFVRRQRLIRIQDELATCPQCGEVLDRWWSYRARQIKEWKATHLRSHQTETDKPSNDQDL